MKKTFTTALEFATWIVNHPTLLEIRKEQLLMEGYKSLIVDDKIEVILNESENLPKTL
jgi:hypothetical protein